MADPTDEAVNDSTIVAHSGSEDNGGQAHELQSGLDNTDESEFNDEFYESDESASMTWISWYCSLKGHEYFCEIPEEFIEDEFNLTGLSQAVNYYVEALDMILDIEDENEEPLDPEEIDAIDNSAEILYGLIHARYIITRNGLQQMADKYENGDFGLCPRFACDGTYLAPCGRSDIPERDSVKLYCPSCLDVYNPPSSRYLKIDGAYFGTTFPHLFFHSFPSLIPESPTPIYIPQIYGFAINERSKAGPRMQWLRMRPENVGDSDDDDDKAGSGSDEASAAGSLGSAGDRDGNGEPRYTKNDHSTEQRPGYIDLSGNLKMAASLSPSMNEDHQRPTSSAVNVSSGIDGIDGGGDDKTHSDDQSNVAMRSQKITSPSRDSSAQEYNGPEAINSKGAGTYQRRDNKNNNPNLDKSSNDNNHAIENGRSDGKLLDKQDVEEREDSKLRTLTDLAGGNSGSNAMNGQVYKQQQQKHSDDDNYDEAMVTASNSSTPTTHENRRKVATEKA